MLQGIVGGYTYAQACPSESDAILDRLVHNAHRLQLTGESMRKQSARNQTLDANTNP
jgi:DNA replication protein DnaC